MEKVGKNIKNQRTKLGMSQETLAEKFWNCYNTYFRSLAGWHI
mgnify:CR=1 FL=1